MSLIEHWWLIVGPDGHAFEVRDEQPDPILGHGRPFKDRVVEVAPADQLAGAVDLLHELADAVAENQASPDVRYSHRVREALEAIDAAGYRPSTRGQ